MYMAENLTFKYDLMGDILYIDKCQAYSEQESEEIGDDIIARLNPNTGEVENLDKCYFFLIDCRNKLNGKFPSWQTYALIKVC